jgi:hypothetical protein
MRVIQMRSIKQGEISLIFACAGFIIVGFAGAGPRPMEDMVRAHTLIEATDKDGNAQRYAPADLQRAVTEVVQSNATLRSESNRELDNSVNTAPPPASSN